MKGSGPQLDARGASLDCQEAEVLVCRRLDGELDETDAPRLTTHLQSCAHCRQLAEEWWAQSEQLQGTLNSLWIPAHGQLRPASPAVMRTQRVRSKATRRAMWLPVGMVASQVLALVGLSVYFVFFGVPASAPPSVSHRAATDEGAQPAREPVENRAERIAATKPVAPAPLPDSGAVRRPDLALALEAVLAHVEHAPPTLTSELVFATPQVAPPPRVIENCSLRFQLLAPSGATERRGRIYLLGDVLNNKGLIRVVGEDGKHVDVAQGDIDTLVQPPLRPLVHSFIAECQRPALRSRIEAAQKIP